MSAPAGPPGAVADRPLAPLCTWRVGGRAAWFAQVEEEGELVRLLEWAAACSITPVVLGAGSNLLIPEGRLEALVLRLGRSFRWVRRSQGGGEPVIVAGGAQPLPGLALWASKEGLAGPQALYGIPGTIGGALRMNAGALGVDMAHLTRRVRLVSRDGAAWVSAGELNFGYRHSALATRRPPAVVTQVELDARTGDAAALRARIADEQRRRRHTQPYGVPSGGSTFRNPDPHHPAGRLIDRCGLKGTRVGGAHVSRLHANFILTDKGASADDVFEVMQRVAEVVFHETGILLEPEVTLWGAYQHRWEAFTRLLVTGRRTAPPTRPR